MIINNNVQQYGLYTTYSNPSNSQSPINPVNTQSTAHSDTVKISNEGHKAQAKWQEIAAQYDVTDLSTNERVEMAGQLQKNGLIPDDIMIFMVMPSSMNTDLNQKEDFLGAIKESFEMEKSSGLGQKQLEMRIKSIEILEHLHELH